MTLSRDNMEDRLDRLVFFGRGHLNRNKKDQAHKQIYKDNSSKQACPPQVWNVLAKCPLLLKCQSTQENPLLITIFTLFQKVKDSGNSNNFNSGESWRLSVLWHSMETDGFFTACFPSKFGKSPETSISSKSISNSGKHINEAYICNLNSIFCIYALSTEYSSKWSNTVFQWTSAPVQRKTEVQKIKEKCNKGAYLLTFFQLCTGQGKQKLKTASKPS